MKRFAGTPTAGDSPSSGGLAASLLAAGTIVGAFLVGLRVDARNRGSRAGGGDRGGESLGPAGTAREIPIGGDVGDREPGPGAGRDAGPADESPDVGAEGMPGQADEGMAEQTDEGAQEGADEGMPGVDRTPGEIAERTEADADEEPAEPGEMAVDEDVVEEAVDEGADEEATEELSDAGDADGGTDDE